ncbi:MAG TPA: hypothetical protein VKS82_00870 [Streptosporangiaceae bacterium]|jgi:hypothetical protein|nr:hypothetical protein [Streptosporangiaceae bacterium]
MMLADHAQVADGKLFIAGGGWTSAGPGPVPCGIALLFHVPWQQTNERTVFTLSLLDEDYRPFPDTGLPGERPVQASGQIEAGRPPGTAPGAEINVPVAFNTVLQLPPGRRFTWVLEIDGQTDESWRLSFATREATQAHPQ